MKLAALFLLLLAACGPQTTAPEFIEDADLLRDDPCCCIYPNPDDFSIDDEVFTNAETCRTLAGGCLTQGSIDALQTPHVCCENAAGATCGE